MEPRTPSPPLFLTLSRSRSPPSNKKRAAWHHTAPPQKSCCTVQHARAPRRASASRAAQTGGGRRQGPTNRPEVFARPPRGRPRPRQPTPKPQHGARMGPPARPPRPSRPRAPGKCRHSPPRRPRPRRPHPASAARGRLSPRRPLDRAAPRSAARAAPPVRACWGPQLPRPPHARRLQSLLRPHRRSAPFSARGSITRRPFPFAMCAFGAFASWGPASRRARRNVGHAAPPAPPELGPPRRPLRPSQRPGPSKHGGRPPVAARPPPPPLLLSSPCARQAGAPPPPPAHGRRTPQNPSPCVSRAANGTRTAWPDFARALKRVRAPAPPRNAPSASGSAPAAAAARDCWARRPARPSGSSSWAFPAPPRRRAPLGIPPGARGAGRPSPSPLEWPSRPEPDTVPPAAQAAGAQQQPRSCPAPCARAPSLPFPSHTACVRDRPRLGRTQPPCPPPSKAPPTPLLPPMPLMCAVAAAAARVAAAPPHLLP
jgi:hypothetical protein